MLMKHYQIPRKERIMIDLDLNNNNIIIKDMDSNSIIIRIFIVLMEEIIKVIKGLKIIILRNLMKKWIKKIMGNIKIEITKGIRDNSSSSNNNNNKIKIENRVDF